MAKSKFNQQVYDSFIESHKPIQNHLVKGAPYNGTMFETYGVERDFIKSQPNNKVCTIVDGEGQDLLIIGGIHFCNRIGYLVLENPLSDEQVKNLEIVC